MIIKPFAPVERSEVPEMTDAQEKVLLPIYDQIDMLTRALQGRLNFPHNFKTEERDLSIRSGVPVTISCKKVSNPRGVLVVGPLSYYPFYKWDYGENSNEIILTVDFNTHYNGSGSEPDTEIMARILIYEN